MSRREVVFAFAAVVAGCNQPPTRDSRKYDQPEASAPAQAKDLTASADDVEREILAQAPDAAYDPALKRMLRDIAEKEAAMRADTAPIPEPGDKDGAEPEWPTDARSFENTRAETQILRILQGIQVDEQARLMRAAGERADQADASVHKENSGSYDAYSTYSINVEWKVRELIKTVRDHERRRPLGNYFLLRASAKQGDGGQAPR